MASNPATRETALFIPDALPACSAGAEFMTVVVSGATNVEVPSPSSSTAGKNVLQ